MNSYWSFAVAFVVIALLTVWLSKRAERKAKHRQQSEILKAAILESQAKTTPVTRTLPPKMPDMRKSRPAPKGAQGPSITDNDITTNPATWLGATSGGEYDDSRDTSGSDSTSHSPGSNGGGHSHESGGGHSHGGGGYSHGGGHSGGHDSGGYSSGSDSSGSDAGSF